jgi:hypothetical protein
MIAYCAAVKSADVRCDPQGGQPRKNAKDFGVADLHKQIQQKL